MRRLGWCAVVASLAACGADGADGRAGKDAALAEVRGTARGPDGPLLFAPVRVVALADDGAPLLQLAGSVTDGAGAYSLLIADSVGPSSRLAVEVLAGERRLRAFVIDRANQEVSPSREALVDVVTLVTASPEGRTLEDFTPAELADLDARVDDAVAGVAPNDPEALRAALLEGLGAALVEAAGAAITLERQAFVDAPDVTTSEPTGPVALLTAGGMEFTVARDCTLDDASYRSGNTLLEDAYDEMFELSINGSNFLEGPVLVEDEREVACAPQLVGPVEVARKVHVDEAANRVRFTEILRNPGAEAVTVNLEIFGNLGSDNATTPVASSSGDAQVDGEDRWFATGGDPGDPVNGFWFGDAPTEILLNADSLLVRFPALELAPGERRTVFHWATLGVQPPDPDALRTALGALPPSEPSGYPGATAADVNAAINVVPPTGVAVRGDAGAAPPFATVTVTNPGTGVTRQGRAESDGSFLLTLPADPGATVRVATQGGVLGEWVAP